jgi:hypothetical protein
MGVRVRVKIFRVVKVNFKLIMTCGGTGTAGKMVTQAQLNPKLTNAGVRPLKGVEGPGVGDGADPSASALPASGSGLSALGIRR